MVREHSVKTSHQVLKQYIAYTVLFCIVATISLYPLIIENRSLIRDGDAYNQYYPTLVYIGRYIRELASELGNGSIKLFDFSIGLGSDVLTTLSYYGFGDPLNAISTFVPSLYTGYLYTFLVIFKWYLGGAFFLWYGNRKKWNRIGNITGAILYAFGSYSFYYGTLFQEFGNVLFLLPLMLGGVDKILESASTNIKNKHIRLNRDNISLVFIISIFLTALQTFYFLYIETAILLVYVTIYLISNKKYEEHNSYLTKILLIVEHYVVGCMLGGVVLISSIYSFFHSSRVGVDASFSWGKLFGTPGIEYYKDIFSSILLPSNSGFGLTIIAIIAVISLILYKNKDRYILYNLLVWIIGILSPAILYIMSGFENYEARFSFAPIFFASCCVAMMWEKITRSAKASGYQIVGLIIYGAILLLFRRNYGTNAHQIVYILPLLFLTNILIIIGACQRKHKYLHYIVIFAAIIANICVAERLRFDDIYNIKGYSLKYQYISYDDLKQDYDSNIASEYSNVDNDFYRIDGYDSSVNSAMRYGGRSCNSYFSMQNEYLMDFIRETNDSPGERQIHQITGLDSRWDLMALLNVRYYEPLTGGNKIYSPKETPYMLPLGSVYSKIITESEAEKLSALEKSYCMLDTLIVPDSEIAKDDKSTTEISDELNEENVSFKTNDSESILSDDYIIANDDNQYFEIIPSFTENQKKIISSGNDGDYMVFVKINDLEYEGDYSHIWVNDNEITIKSTVQSDKLIHVNVNKDNMNDAIKIECEFSGKYTFSNITIVFVDCRNYSSIISNFTKQSQQDFKLTSNGLEGTVTSQGGRAFFSIPYSEGWTAKIDGVNADIVKTDYSFMSVMVPKGTHEIVISYYPEYLNMALTLNIIGVLIFFSILTKWCNTNENINSK